VIRWFFSKTGDPVAPGEMPFLDHLEELRRRIIWSLVAFAVSAIIGFILVTQFDVLGLLMEPIEQYLENGKLRVLSPTDPFFLMLQLALTIGMLLAAPIVIQLIWGFVSPALTKRERQAMIPAFYLGLVLFMGGAALAYFLALPITLKFMMGFQVDSLQPDIVAGPYLAFVVKLLLGFGLIFEMPVVIALLAAIGIVNTEMLKARRRHAAVVNVIVASLITPGDVIVLTVFLMIPLILLYELSIKLAGLVERRRAVKIAELEAELSADLDAPLGPA